METIVHEFTITRTVRREPYEIELKASFEVEEQVKGAELVGEVFLAVGDIPWEGKLTKVERRRAEASAYETWADSNDVPRHRAGRHDACLVDPDFDDGFDDNMAIKVQGLGSVTW